MNAKPPDTVPPKKCVLISTPFYEPAYLGGGPIQTIKALIDASPEEYDSSIICLNHDLGVSHPLTDTPDSWISVGRARVRYISGSVKSYLSATNSTRSVNIVYLNSLFNPRFSILPMALFFLGFWPKAILLVAPRGELDPGALELKAMKKLSFLRVFRMLRLQQSIAWHASSNREAENIRNAIGPRAQILIRENETSLPPTSRAREARCNGDFRIVFVSRLHPKKGLLTLLQALKGIHFPLTLEIIGAFEDKHYEILCTQAIGELPENIQVNLRGPLPRNEVLTSLRRADIFAFPTAGENFGHVIAEALAESCPVLCSKHTPWTELLQQGGGQVVDDDVPSWTEAICQFYMTGLEGWESLSSQAGQIYNIWQSGSKGKHIYKLVEDAKL